MGAGFHPDTGERGSGKPRSKAVAWLGEEPPEAEGHMDDDSEEELERAAEIEN